MKMRCSPSRRELSPRLYSLAFATTVLLAATIFAAGSLSASPLPQGRGRLTGTVSDAQGNGFVGVRVSLTHTQSGRQVETVTDDRGRWVKGNLMSGEWTVDFFATGYTPVGKTIQVSEIRRSPPINVTLEIDPEAVEPSGSDVIFGGEVGKAVSAGNELYDAGDFEASLAAFEGILANFSEEDSPNVYLAHLNAGNSAVELERYDVALSHFTAVIERDPESTDARIGLAKVHLAERRLPEALEQLDQIDREAVRDPVVFYNVGSLLFGEGQANDAATYFALSIERNPGFADAHFQLALCLLQSGNNDKAREHLQKVIELEPDSSNAALAKDFLATIR